MSYKFSERLKQIRKEKSVKQDELADYLSVGRTSISNWETGISEPDIDTIIKISVFFGVSSDYLLGKTDVWSNNPTYDQELAFKLRQLSPVSQETIEELINQLSKLDLKK